MRFIIKEQYYKRSRPTQSLAQFEAWRAKKNGTTIRAIIHKDPLLKLHPRIEKEIVKHELRELKLNYTDVSNRKNSHKIAKSKEPAWLRKDVNNLREQQKNLRWRLVKE